MDIRPCAAGVRDVVQQVAYTKANYPSAATLSSRTMQNVVSRWGEKIQKYRLEIPFGVVAIRIQVENGGNANAVSANQEMGLLQLWPQDLKTYNVTNAFDPDQNLRAGCEKWVAAGKRFVSKVHTSVGASMRLADAWPMVQLDTMIGGGAMARMVLLAHQRGYPISLGGLNDLVSRSDANTILEASKGFWGTQTSACVAHRVVVAGIMDETARIIDPAYGMNYALSAAGLLALSWFAARYLL